MAGLGDIAGTVADTIEVRSNLWFPIRVRPFAAKEGGFSLADLVRPHVIAYDVQGNVSIDAAPNGEPSPVPLLPVLLLLLAIALISWAVLK